MSIVFAKQRDYGKPAYFNPLDKEYRAGDVVILDIGKIKDYGTILIGNHDVDPDSLPQNIHKVLRPTNNFDLKKIEENHYREKKAFKFCKKVIREKSLAMNLISVEYTFDRKKLRFYFTSNEKVDFRDLIKELVEEFKTGVDIRQIGVRDASKIMGGIGICGRMVCCHTFLNEFSTVNLKIARSQNILSSPEKISGCCGRLRCCLLYEYDNYKDNRLNDESLDQKSKPNTN